jgi:hypothetical protein
MCMCVFAVVGRPAVKNNNTHITLCYTTVGKSAERAKRASIIWASDVKASVSSPPVPVCSVGAPSPFVLAFC